MSTIIVGNSVELLKYEYGSFIDSHDVVVRLGKGWNTRGREKHIGTKLDVWATGLLREYLYEQVKAPLVLYNRNRANMNKPKQISIDAIEMFSDEELLELHREYGYKRRMSNGLVAVLYYVKKVREKNLKIIGFDGFSKSYSYLVGMAKPFSWHNPKNLIEEHPHDGEKEREILSSLELEWIVLSDFTREEL